MEIVNILGWIIVVVICLLFAPLMTIGVILIYADDLGLIGDILGTFCIFAGFVHMLVKFFKE